MKCKVRRTQIQEHRRIKRQEANKERLSFIGSSISYLCSSCTQQRLNTDFGRFSTCSSCRSTNKKSAQRRKDTIKPRYRAPTLQEVKEHLQEWVVGDGEQEVKLQYRKERYFQDFVLIPGLRRPLTVEDYLEGSDRGVSTNQGVSTDSMSGKATAEPGTQT